jgi:hypothetical protein
VNRDDGSPGPEISVADKRIQLSPGLYQSGVDKGESLTLLGRVVRQVWIQDVSLRSRVVRTV